MKTKGHENEHPGNKPDNSFQPNYVFLLPNAIVQEPRATFISLTYLSSDSLRFCYDYAHYTWNKIGKITHGVDLFCKKKSIIIKFKTKSTAHLRRYSSITTVVFIVIINSLKRNAL